MKATKETTTKQASCVHHWICGKPKYVEMVGDIIPARCKKCKSTTTFPIDPFDEEFAKRRGRFGQSLEKLKDRPIDFWPDKNGRGEK